MIWFFLFVTAGLLLSNYFLIKLLRENTAGRERDQRFMLQQTRDFADRLMHVTGQTWTPPPRITYDDDIEADIEEAKDEWRPA